MRWEEKKKTDTTIIHKTQLYSKVTKSVEWLRVEAPQYQQQQQCSHENAHAICSSPCGSQVRFWLQPLSLITNYIKNMTRDENFEWLRCSKFSSQVKENLNCIEYRWWCWPKDNWKSFDFMVAPRSILCQMNHWACCFTLQRLISWKKMPKWSPFDANTQHSLRKNSNRINK